MKVLIADFDLFSRLGGGQTFYRRLIETNPDIQFYYLIDTEDANNKRPNNARTFSYQQQYIKADLKIFKGEIPLNTIYRPFLMASNMAASVSGESFDIIDCPDYEQYGMFLRPALEFYRVDFKKIVLSLHGKISRSLRLDWYVDKNEIEALDYQEKLQYKTVDIRYGISKDYLEEWQELINIDSYYLDPLQILELSQPKSIIANKKKPNLNYIGRKEKCKGADIFVNLVSFIPRNLYSKATIIGPDSQLKNGQTSEKYLQKMLDLRLSDISLAPAMNKQKIEAIFQTKSITFLPSRADTLNLIALESLFSGCPTVIGNGAGVCRFLKENFPQVPFIELDVNNLYGCLPEIMDLLTNYDAYLQKLRASLVGRETKLNELKLIDIYNKPINCDLKIRDKIANWYQQLITHCQRRQYGGKPIVINFLKTTVKPIYENSQKKLNQLIFLTKYLKNTYRAQLVKSIFYPQQLQAIVNLPETTETQLNDKLEQLGNLSQTINPEAKNWREKLKSGYLLERVKIWREMARLEQIRGNELVAATYKIRGMRLLGSDRFNELADIINILNQHGFSREAQVVTAMYSKANHQEKLGEQLLPKAYQDNLDYRPQEYEFSRDCRHKSSYRVAVVVSLYNAANKLTRFLQVLASQTLLQKQEAEVILIDSGSTEGEYQIFQQLAPQLNLPLVYTRTKNRETIQSAWNRGILLSRSPYLTFLGVDETMVPEALAILATELDRDANLDWVVGHSLVTNVDRQGNWLNDIMLYNRRGYEQDLVYLDTCYLTYVGGLYRRSIHHRFGYYDSSFRGAGDTEFKNRVLPYIKSKMIDRVLGIFWNYPDQRTTQSPLAEIEDLRAWYLHRTLEGVKYAFEQRNPEEAENLLYHALAYRKSFCEHLSTDFEYAGNLSQFLAVKNPDSPLGGYFTGIKTMLNAYRNLEYLPELPSLSYLNRLWRTYNLAQKIAFEHQNIAKSLGKNNFNPHYKLFNDNRFEQHCNLWSSTFS
jgi:glycosyltransferase involved in cell wall biosynthesis